MVTENLPPSGSLIGAPLESPFNGWKIVKEDPVDYKDMNPRGLEFVFGAVKKVSGDNPNPMNRLVAVYQKPSEGDYVIVSVAADNINDMRIFDITNEWYGDPEPGPEHLFKKVMEMADDNKEGLIETADAGVMQKSMVRETSNYGEYGKVDSYIETASLIDAFREKLDVANEGKKPSASHIKQYAEKSIENNKQMTVFDNAMSNAISPNRGITAQPKREIGGATKLKPNTGGSQTDVRGQKPGLGSPMIETPFTKKKTPTKTTPKTKGSGFDWKGARNTAWEIGKVAGTGVGSFAAHAAKEIYKTSAGGKTVQTNLGDSTIKSFGGAIGAVKNLYKSPKKKGPKTTGTKATPQDPKGPIQNEYKNTGGYKGAPKSGVGSKTKDYNKGKGGSGSFWKKPGASGTIPSWRQLGVTDSYGKTH